MLVTSIFSFSHNVFKRLLFKGCVGKVNSFKDNISHFRLYHKIRGLNHLKKKKVFENIVREEVNASNKYFLSFQQ